MNGSETRRAAGPFLSPSLSSYSSLRSDGQVAYGYSLMRGRRATMEDFHHAAVSSKRQRGALFFRLTPLLHPSRFSRSPLHSHSSTTTRTSTSRSAYLRSLTVSESAGERERERGAIGGRGRATLASSPPTLTSLPSPLSLQATGARTPPTLSKNTSPATCCPTPSSGRTPWRR